VLNVQQYLDYWQYDATTRGSARGHQELADGSTIEMNTGSALDVDYGVDTRRVTLARGEAFFDVKRDPAKPFIIKAGAGEVRVLGTAFSVKREGDGARVTVIRGKVRVSSAGKFVDIVSNEQVRFDGGAPQAVRTVDAETVLAWSDGRLVLRNRPLGEVLAAVDRYYPGAIVLTDDAAAEKRVDAVVNLDRIDDWVEQLQNSQKLTARRFPGVVAVAHGRPPPPDRLSIWLSRCGVAPLARLDSEPQCRGDGGPSHDCISAQTLPVLQRRWRDVVLGDRDRAGGRARFGGDREAHCELPQARARRSPAHRLAGDRAHNRGRAGLCRLHAARA